MQQTHILVRAGELFLKGKNLPYFERMLVQNIQKLCNIPTVQTLRGRSIVPYFKDHLLLKRVFGITSYSPAVRVEKTLEAIKWKALELMQGRKGTFKIEPKRSDKRFPLTSPELNVILGKWIEEQTSLRFEGQTPDHLLGIEINSDGAYLFDEIIPCFGGLPTGTEGSVLLLVEDEASLLSGILLMKRGCYVVPISFCLQDISLLQKFSPKRLELKLVHNFKEIERMGTIMVCGQRFENYKEYDTALLVLRPLIHYSEKDVGEQLKMFKD